ncbi:MAG: hypothetical protein DRI71_11540 [Bacteroidetes bacterium]|nr:MAG: hypothetical protein DRI71_11540 [Bacteroidota bacterium]
MKKLTGLMMIALLPFLAMAQSKSVTNFQDKYSDHDDATFVTIKGSLFNLIASVADYDDKDDPDEDLQAFGRIADGIKSMEVLRVPFYETDLNREELATFKKALQKEGYEEFIMVKEGKELVNVLAQGAEDEIRNMLVMVEEKEDFTLISINGTLSMKDLSYLSKNHSNFH